MSDANALVNELAEFKSGDPRYGDWFEKALAADAGELVMECISRLDEIRDEFLGDVPFFLARSRYTESFSSHAYQCLLAECTSRPQSLHNAALSHLLQLFSALNVQEYLESDSLTEALRLLIGRGLFRGSHQQYSATTVLEILNEPEFRTLKTAVLSGDSLGARLILVGVSLESSDARSRSLDSELEMSAAAPIATAPIIRRLLAMQSGAWRLKEGAAWFNDSLKHDPQFLLESMLPFLASLPDANFTFLAATMQRPAGLNASNSAIRYALVGHTAARPGVLDRNSFPKLVSAISKWSPLAKDSDPVEFVDSVAILLARGLAAEAAVSLFTLDVWTSLSWNERSLLRNSFGVAGRAIVIAEELAKSDKATLSGLHG